MFLVDTNVISELRRLQKADRRVVAWVESVESTDMYLSAITLLELEIGVLRAERSDPAKGAGLRRWLTDQVTPAFVGRILPVNEHVAKCCAALHVPNPKPEREALIAATALMHKLTLVTRNITDFKPTGAILLNPWSINS